MAELIRTETRPSGLKVYVYKCDVCGGETERYLTRANQRKVCCDCQRRLDREKVKAGQMKKEMEIKNKTIDDFVEKIKLKYLGVHPDELHTPHYAYDIVKDAKNIAEQLKGK